MTQRRKNRIGERVRCSVNSDIPYWANVPRPLPPADLELDSLQPLIEKANQALGRLDGLATALPDIELFLYSYVRKEAVLSSQIEGTQSSLSDLLAYESDITPGVPLQDVEEVSRYVAALNHGIESLAHGLPLTLRLIKEMHVVLMSGARGGTRAAGEFRRSQNWVGGTNPGNATYVPPPPERVFECMSDLEKFIHQNDNLPIIVKSALMHHQFETVHPFLDGNGRLGRLMIALMLCSRGVLKQPLLYLSLYFKTERSEYYAQLQQVRETGNWESWIEFFLQGVLRVSIEAADTAGKIVALTTVDKAKISGLGRGAKTAQTVYKILERKPLVTIAEIVKETGVSTPTATAALLNLMAIDIVREKTGRQRGRIFVYDAYMSLLTNNMS